MKKLIITERYIYTSNTTIGRIVNPDTCEHWAYCLEDTVRPTGIKVYKHTAIPAMTYKVTVTYSNRFKRDMIQLYNVDADLSIDADGKKFTGVRVHGGNDHTNTEGCPLVAYNLINNETIQGTAEKEFTTTVKQWIAEGYEVLWKFINLPQES